MPRLLLTVPEAAEALAISRSKLYELLTSGALASIRIDGSRRIPLTALEEYVSRTPAQLRAFLDTARQHRLFAFYRLAAYTGARRGELLNLRWRDVDLDLGEVRITGSAAVIAGQRIEGTTKSGRSRTVSIDPALCRSSKITASARPRNG